MLVNNWQTVQQRGLEVQPSGECHLKHCGESPLLLSLSAIYKNNAPPAYSRGQLKYCDRTFMSLQSVVVTPLNVLWYYGPASPTCVCVCVTFRVFLLGVVRKCSGHTEVHVTVFAVVRFLPGVQPHVILQWWVGAELGTAVFTGKWLLIKVFCALVVTHAWNVAGAWEGLLLVSKSRLTSHWKLTWWVCEGPPTEVTGHFPFDLCGVAVGVSLVPLQGALVGQLGRTLWALQLVLRGHGAALQVGQHPALVGKVLHTPAAGIRSIGGWRRGGVCRSIKTFLLLTLLILTGFFLFLLGLFIWWLLLVFSCKKSKKVKNNVIKFSNKEKVLLFTQVLFLRNMYFHNFSYTLQQSPKYAFLNKQ